MARKALFSNVIEIATAIHAILNGGSLPYNHTRRLIDSGLIVSEKSAEPRLTRGRKAFVFKPTAKGRAIYNFNKRKIAE